MPEIKQNALIIGEQIEQQNIMLENLEENMDQANIEVRTTTKRIKEMLTQLRAPDKCCFTVILILILIGLITVAANMLQSSL